MSADPAHSDRIDEPPNPHRVLGYASASVKQRANVTRAVTWFLAGHLSSILIFEVIDGSIAGMIDPQALLILVLFVVVTTLTFLSCFLLIRPYAHPRRWPPYALAFTAGIVVLLAWMGLSNPIFRFMITSVVGWFSLMTWFFTGLAVISFCTCLVFVVIYRVTVDRLRHRSGKAGE